MRVVNPDGSVMFVCFAEDFHPYECDGRGKCRHCDRTKDETHDPDICAFCRDDAGLDADPEEAAE